MRHFYSRLICTTTCLFPVLLVLVLYLSSELVQQTEATFPYAIRGYVQDVRHRPGLLIGGWALKKALKLKKLKILIALKIKLKLKLLAKKLLFKFLLGRKRRSLVSVHPDDYYDQQQQQQQHEIDLPDNMIPEIHENDIIPYYVMATEFDQDGCLPKSICDVMVRNVTGRSPPNNNGNELTQFERMITEDYANVIRPENTQSPSFVYEYAAYYGRTSKSERACASLFSTCHEDAIKLNKIMDGSYRTDICDSPDEVEYYSPQQSQIFSTQAQSSHYHQDSASAGGSSSTLPLDYQDSAAYPVLQQYQSTKSSSKLRFQ